MYFDASKPHSSSPCPLQATPTASCRRRFHFNVQLLGWNLKAYGTYYMSYTRSRSRGRRRCLLPRACARGGLRRSRGARRASPISATVSNWSGGATPFGHVLMRVMTRTTPLTVPSLPVTARNLSFLLLSEHLPLGRRRGSGPLPRASPRRLTLLPRRRSFRRLPPWIAPRTTAATLSKDSSARRTACGRAPGRRAARSRKTSNRPARGLTATITSARPLTPLAIIPRRVTTPRARRCPWRRSR